MKMIDVRFSASEMIELQHMIGKRLIKYKCDPFEFSTSVYGIVGISLEDSSYALTNFSEAADYYGTIEDVAQFKLTSKPFSEIHSFIQNQAMIEFPVDSIITEILVVNEHQQLFENGEKSYDVLLTRGIIFRFDDERELSFEKNIWFSEEISVEKGYNLIDRFTSTSEFPEGWSTPYRGECSREIVKLS